MTLDLLEGLCWNRGAKNLVSTTAQVGAPSENRSAIYVNEIDAIDRLCQDTWRESVVITVLPKHPSYLLEYLGMYEVVMWYLSV